MQQQLLIAGRGLIDPTIPIGGLAFSDSDSRTYSGNGSNVLISNNSFTIPNNWKTKTWRYSWSITCSASYTSLGYNLYLYKNGVQVYSSSTPADQNSYWRYNSGTRSGTFDMSLAKGDTVLAQLYMRGRNVGGSTPNATSSHQLARLT